MTTTEAAIRLIKQGSNGAFKQLLQQMLGDAGTWRPLGYQGSQTRRRDHLVGNSAVHVRAKLKKLYPKTWEKIEPLPYNFARHSAATAASFYDEEPTRELIDVATLKEVPKEDARAEAFREALEQSRISVVLPSADERAEWMGDSVVAIRVRDAFDPGTGEPVRRVRCELHWADHVWVLPDASSPTDLQRANGWVLKVKASKDGRVCDAYELWTRSNGGAWLVSTQTSDGDVLIPEEEYQGRMLPFVMLHAEDPDALPYVERGDDDVDMVEMLVVGQSDAAHIGRMQGHTDRVYKGTRKKSHEIVGGPDATIQIDTGEELTSLDYNPKIVELDASNVKQMKTWALTKQHPLHSYTVEGQSPESGIARAIANEARDKMKKRRDTLLVEKEERELLPIIAEVWSTFIDAARPITGCRFKVTPRRPKPHEDLESKQRRLREDLDLGVISLARYAVEMGHYDSVEDAVEAGIPDDLKAAKPPAPVGPDGRPLSGFAARLQAQRDARGEEDETPPALEADDATEEP